MKPRTILVLIGAAALVAVLAIGLSQRPKDEAKRTAPLSLGAQQRALAGSPPPLAALHAQANVLLGGGKGALHARLAALKGYPVVMNKWASWCAPCRAEFAFFQRAAAHFGTRVAFVGLNSGDGNGAAASFLRLRPVSYPSYTDPREKAALDFGIGTNYPVTVFFGADGKRHFIHQGAYPTLARLEHDIQSYALS